MKLATRTLALVAVLCLFGSLASARPIRTKATQTGGFYFGLNAAGNFAKNSPNGVAKVKSIVFPNSGININRARQINSVNASGKRQVIQNRVLRMLGTDGRFVQMPTRSRQVFPKGRARKNNLVAMRLFAIFNPKKVEEEV